MLDGDGTWFLAQNASDLVKSAGSLTEGATDAVVFSFSVLSIHNAVISVFQRKELAENDLYTLNEGVRSVEPQLLFCSC